MRTGVAGFLAGEKSVPAGFVAGGKSSVPADVEVLLGPVRMGRDNGSWDILRRWVLERVILYAPPLFSWKSRGV